MKKAFVLAVLGAIARIASAQNAATAHAAPAASTVPAASPAPANAAEANKAVSAAAPVKVVKYKAPAKDAAKKDDQPKAEATALAAKADAVVTPVGK